MFDTDPGRAVKALTWVQESLRDSTSASRENTGREEIAFTLSDPVQDVSKVVGSVPEQISLKTHEIDKLVHPMTIIATNSSSIRSSRLLSRPSNERQHWFLNTHYFRPSEIPIVELMTCGRTSAAVINETVSSAEDIDRVFMANFHVAWGPCELMDMVGLQRVCDIEDVHIATCRPTGSNSSARTMWQEGT